MKKYKVILKPNWNSWECEVEAENEEEAKEYAEVECDSECFFVIDEIEELGD